MITKTEEEIFRKDQLVDLFTFEACSKSSSKFDLGKLKWTNNYYLQLLSINEAYDFLNHFLPNEIKSIYDENKQKAIIELYRPQLKEGIELKELSSIFVAKNKMIAEDEEYLKSESNAIEIKEYINKNLGNFDWTLENIKAFIKELGKALEIKGKNLYRPIRLMLFGESHGPALSELMFLIGKEEIEKRINQEW